MRSTPFCKISPALQEASESLLNEFRGQDVVKGNSPPRDWVDHVVVSVDARCLLPSGGQLSNAHTETVRGIDEVVSAVLVEKVSIILKLETLYTLSLLYISE